MMMVLIIENLNRLNHRLLSCPYFLCTLSFSFFFFFFPFALIAIILQDTSEILNPVVNRDKLRFDILSSLSY